MRKIATGTTLPLIEEKVFSVAEFIEVLNTFFKKEKIRLTGEICQFKRAVSGHIYFTVKDKESSSVLDCIMWGRNYDLCGVKLEPGMEVILSGQPNIYPQSGKLSFIADTVELVGEGALKKAYDELKRKLEAEGVFAPEHKRELPEYIKKIGVITSREGAVIHDFINNLGKFGFEVNLVDSRVEGQQAVKSLMEAMSTLAKKDIEVLVIIRGGGSLESLQAFNNEALVRAVTHFPVPVIAGIGHDQDVPLLALAADYMTSTPTAAAHLLSRSWEEAYAKIRQVPFLLTRISQEFRRIRTDLDTAWSTVLDHTSSRIEDIKKQLAFTEQVLRLNDPARQLKLGYAIPRKGGKIVRSAEDTKMGDELSLELADGSIITKVQEINKK